MATVKPQTLKGFRDFLPQEARKRQYVIDILKKVFESYGFEPLETPALEYEEILIGKYGEAGDKLMYRFVDRGNRKVALRYDQTVPLARVVAQYQNELPMPFKRYQIQNVWRADNTQKGRFREFMQCDIDTVGSMSSLADSEIIACVITAIKKLGFKKITMNINDRDVFVGIETKYMTIIDKLPKIGQEAVKKELTKSMSEKEAQKILDDLLNQKLTTKIAQIFSYLKSLGFTQDIDFIFDQTIVRGLDYYTGTIFELVDPKNPSLSLGGGGRYDKLIGMFSNKQIPAVGFSFGFDRLIDAMTELKLFPDDLQATKVLVTVFSSELLEKSLEVSSYLRSNNINTELYLDENSKMEKQLKYADKKGIPYAIIIGPDEASKNMITLRNMKARQQEILTQKDLVSKLV
jgi:histidyl-tRNA synthetase